MTAASFYFWACFISCLLMIVFATQNMAAGTIVSAMAAFASFYRAMRIADQEPGE